MSFICCRGNSFERDMYWQGVTNSFFESFMHAIFC